MPDLSFFPTASQILVVVNKRLPGITVYDAVTMSPIGEARTAIAPHEVVLSTDGCHAYVPIYGSSGVGKPGTDEHAFHIFDIPNCRLLATIDTGLYKRPHSLVVGRSGIVYVTAEIAASVILIDPTKQEIIGHIPTGSFTSHFIALNQDETRLYCSNVQSKTVSVIDVPGRKIVATVETNGENQRMTLSPDGRWFVTSLGPAQQIAFFRTADHALEFSVPVDGRPFVAKFSRDGRFLYNAGHKDGTVHAWKIDVSRREIAATASDLGRDVGSLEVNPFDGTVYISDQPTNQITILDSDRWLPVRTVATAPAPDAMAFGEVSMFKQ